MKISARTYGWCIDEIMKKIFPILSLVLGLTSSLNSVAAIYGNDDRKDIFQLPWLKPIAQSVAISIPNNFLRPLANGNWQYIDPENLSGSSSAFTCSDERFGNQPTIGNCTGFLVGDRYLITAGHCVLNTGISENDSNSPYCEAFRWYFDFNVSANGKTTVLNIPANRLYKCSRIIRAENIEGGNDFAVVELERIVSSDLKPLKINPERPKKGSLVYTIGHPAGLPAKHSGVAPVSSVRNPTYFEVFLDTQGGNSGGPVFDGRNQVLGILFSGHQISTYRSTTGGTPAGCYRWNRCNANGTSCNENPTEPTLQLSNYILYIDIAQKYLPRR